MMGQESPSAAYAEVDEGEMLDQQEPTENQLMQSGEDDEEFVPDPEMETLDLSG